MSLSGSSYLNRYCMHQLGAEPVVASHLVVFPLGEPEGLEDAFGESAHSEEAGPDHADHVVVSRVESDLAYGGPATKEGA